ncbi:hypothetical protein QQF64_003145 [Cirrhinus molitorella]|uniref:Uncharacterized protein n=1 Tax=Cirrhinus molitorella TaxID=172907 RepID=A0ABR3MJ98_9TELE
MSRETPDQLSKRLCILALTWILLEANAGFSVSQRHWTPDVTIKQPGLLGDMEVRSSPTCLLTGKRRGVVIGGADVAGLPARQGDSDGWRLAASPTAHLLTGPHALFMRFGAGKRCQKV